MSKPVVRIKGIQPAQLDLQWYVTQTSYGKENLTNAWNSSTTSSSVTWKRRWSVVSRRWRHSKRNVSSEVRVMLRYWLLSILTTILISRSRGCLACNATDRRFRKEVSGIHIWSFPVHSNWKILPGRRTAFGDWKASHNTQGVRFIS